MSTLTSALKAITGLCLGLFTSLPAEGQVFPDSQWSLTTINSKLIVTADGNIAVAAGGEVRSYTPQGVFRWSSIINVSGAFPQSTLVLSADAKGGIAGVFSGYIPRYMYYFRALGKINQAGVQQEAGLLDQVPAGMTANGRSFDGLISLPGDQLVFCTTIPSSVSLTSAAVIKTGSQGWQTTLNYPNASPPNPDRTVTKAERMIATADGGFLLVGYYNPYGVTSDPLSTTAPSSGWVAKLDGQGNVQWQKLMRGFPFPNALSGGDPGAVLSTNIITDVVPIPDGSGYALAGIGYGFSSLVQAPPHTVLVEIDLNGNLKRSKVYPTDATPGYIASYTATDGQTYYALGNTDLSAPNYDYRVMKISTAPGLAGNPASLSLVGERTYSFQESAYPPERLTGISVAGDGGLVLTGSIGVLKLATEAPQPLTLLTPVYDCATQQFTFLSRGGDGSEVTYMAVGITGWTAQKGPHRLQPFCDVEPFILRARQAGNPVAIVTATWNYTATCPDNCTAQTAPPSTTAVNTAECGSPAPAIGQPLMLLPPVYDCQTGAIQFLVSGGNGNPVEFMSVGITGWTTNCHNRLDSPDLVADIQQPGSGVVPFTLFARQRNTDGGYTLVQYRWDAKAACGLAPRSGIDQETGALTVHVLGNPVQQNLVELTIDGIRQEPLTISVHTILGQLIGSKTVEGTQQAIWLQMPLQAGAGTYLIQASTPTRHKSVKVVKL
ncbi:T9SS type A sorting domain-containing protein [Arsenicibacter rosenii]|uniref:Secretion system C-terminal sorting domain-containing protein n=1 Tax=Arsenicibacter rosenii TaxID=1750698 RepID=A0A1S2VL22_9BACT|nr:T9SS type A sorting domain-containing protein [Arsenicibacter rosenii]OIN58488.1 hypothetical protein BLX24_12995 [Arsenicibacter rosenii]